jgi:DNA-binding NarL/FixJ family response regulator
VTGGGEHTATPGAADPRLPIRVLIVDDQALVRAGFRVLVDAAADLQVVGEAGDGVEALQRVGEQLPDVVLMDIRMPGMDGIAATVRIIEVLGDAAPRIVILTTFDADEYVYEALRAGASGFLLKDAEPAQLLTAIRVAAAGEALLAPSVTRRLIAEFASRPEVRRAAPEQLEGLTPREREIMVLVAQGLSNDEIAQRLVLSPLTAKTHVSRILMKLGARDRTQLVVLAYETGLVVPGPQAF